MFDAGCGLYNVADMYDANGSPRSCPLTEHALKTEADLQLAKARYGNCDRSGLTKIFKKVSASTAATLIQIIWHITFCLNHC